jgi:Flp pilus assembly protein CpaB
MNRFQLALRRLRRAVLARRRLLAALSAAVAVAAGLRAASPPPPERSSVLTAARDIGAGVVVSAADLRRAPYDPDLVPAGAFVTEAGAVGRTTTGPVRSGEPMTDARLVTSSLLEGYPGLVAVPVRIGDAGAVRLLRVGDRVDLLAADPQSRGPARVVGRDVPVLAIPREGEQAPGLTNGALVVLGVPDPATRSVAQASVSAFLSVVITR